MKNLIPLLLLLLGGCQEPEPVAVKDPPKTTPLEQPVVQLNPDQKKDPRDKPERIHQLRDLETKKLVVNGHTLTIWLMDDTSKIAEGMMYLTDKDVKDTEGMLFIFPDARPRGFWMQNCPLSLDICYLDPKGKVLNIAVGKPYDETSLPSQGSAQYALELKVGMAKKFGIKPGTVLRLPAGLKSKV